MKSLVKCLDYTGRSRTLTQHCLGEDGQEANRFHEPGNGKHQIGNGSADGPHEEHKVDVRLEVRPLPEVARIEICSIG